MKKIIKKIIAWVMFFLSLIPAALLGLAAFACSYILEGQGLVESVVMGIVVAVIVVVLFSTINID